MAFAQLPSYESFDVKSEGVAIRWKKWVSRLTNNLFVAYDIQEDQRKRALLLTYAGNDLNDIVDNLTVNQPGDGESHFECLVQAVTNYFNPKVNTELQRYTFRHMKQSVGMGINDFHSQLKEMAETCQFANPEEEIKSQLIFGCSSTKVKEKGLTNPNLTSNDLLQYARTMELTRKHTEQMESVDKLSRSKPHHRPKQSKAPYYNKSFDSPRSNPKPGTSKQNPKPFHSKPKSSHSHSCRNCGKPWPHEGGQDNCPAKGKTCHACGKMNHFSNVCRQKNRQNHKVRNLLQTRQDSQSEDESEEDSYVFATADKARNLPIFQVWIHEKRMDVLADSGATTNIITMQKYKEMKPRPQLMESSTKVYGFSSNEPLKTTGKIRTKVRYKDTCLTTEFLVVDTQDIPILGWSSCQALDLLQRVRSSQTKTEEDDKTLTAEFPEVFTGLGKLKDQKVKLHIDTTVQPVAQKYRRIPFHMRQQLDKHLDKEEENGVIEKAYGPTPWISPLVIVPKPKNPQEIRVCVDMRAPNQAIKRERHNMPTLNELSTILANAQFFTKLDLNQGYNQIELDEESRYITTFATHKGLYRFKRLNFGVCSAAEIFQETIRQTLNGLPGTINVSDDILVFGKSKAEHNQNLRKVLERLRNKNLTLNKKKCEFLKTSIEFLGHIFSAEGFKPCPTKLQEIFEMPTPTNASEVRSLLGMMNFCGAHFIPDYATLTYELRQLTQKNKVFKWTEKHDKAFGILKEKLQNHVTLSYFDPNKETQVYVDASPVGVSAILTQTMNSGTPEIVQIASRSLTETEQRYSQTEREALAVTWSCEYFHIYLFGSPNFTVFTDHKPLVSLFGSPRIQLPARIERWVMRTQAYNMKIVYKPGKDNPADYMSRHPTMKTSSSSREQKIADEYVNYLSYNSVPKAMTLEDIKKETLKDRTLQSVIQSLESGKWNKTLDPTYDTLKRCAAELSVTDTGILLKGRKIVLPFTLHAKAVQIAHCGHQGQTKTLAMLREKVWFKCMNSLVEQTVKNCLACQAATPTISREPLKMSPLPTEPWSELSADFGQVPDGTYLLVVMDEYSRYVVVDTVKSTSARAVIPKLDRIFAEFGCPRVIKTDNGPPFNGFELSAYLDSMGIRHRKITPRYPQANGECERFMRTIKKSVKAAITEKKNWKQEMHKFLLAYRTTKHTTTGFAPADVLFNRPVNNKLPSMLQTLPANICIRCNDADAKAKMKQYADQKPYVKQSEIQVGDSVLVKQSDKTKAMTPYEPTPYVVQSKKGSMITAKRHNKSVTRNSSFFKKSPRPPTTEEEEREMSETDSDTPEEPEIEQTHQTQGELQSNNVPIPHDQPPPNTYQTCRPKRKKKTPARFEDYYMN